MGRLVRLGFLMLNSNVVTALSSAYATWQRPQGIMPPRFVKVCVQINF